MENADVNATNWTCRLPVEVLQIVFLLLKRAWPARRDLGIDMIGYELEWIIITHVCYHWRQVALDDVNLWRDLECTDFDPRSASHFLARCKDAELKLKFDIKPSWDLDNMKAWMRGHARIKSLEVHAWDTKTELFLETMAILTRPFHRYMPLLEDLSLVCEDNCGPLTSIYYMFTDIWLGSSFPCLRRLTILDHIISWDSPLLLHSRCLTYLAITTPGYFFDEGMRIPTVPQIVAVLSSMPVIESLILEDVFPVLDPQDDPSYRVVFPPSLRKLDWTVADHFHDCYEFIRYLIVPSSSSVDITFSGEVTDPGPEHYIKSLVVQYTGLTRPRSQITGRVSKYGSQWTYKSELLPT